MLTLVDLQNAVQAGWTDEGYSKAFNESPCLYNHFDHALKHVRKAVQQLENITEEMDHGKEIDPARLEDAKKYLADIMISAARLANVFPPTPKSPFGVVCLEEIMAKRIEQKILPKE